MPKLSVIVPSYNVEPYIATCLNSLVHQTEEDIEVLVIDDASQDSTVQIAHYFEHEYPAKVKVVASSENRGVSHARNVGLKMAQGDYIGFVDSDDVVALNMYLEMLKKMKEYNASVVASSLKRIDDKSYLNQEVFLETSDMPIQLVDCLSAFDKLRVMSVACWNKVFERTFLGKTTFLENHLYEDVSFTYPLLLKASKTIFMPERFYGYRNVPGSIMNRRNSVERNHLDILDVISDALRRGVEYQLSPSLMEGLQRKLKETFCMHVSSIENWDICAKDKRFLIESMLSLGNCYFPNITAEFPYGLMDYEYHSLDEKEVVALRKRLNRKLNVLQSKGKD